MAKMTVAEALAGNTGGLSRKVLEYSNIFKRTAEKAKQPGFTEADWAPLAELIAVDEFSRVGVAKEVMTWTEYRAYLTQIVGAMSWNGFFRRITEVPGVVFLELEEHCAYGDKVDIANTMTVYEFNADGKLHHLDVYLQSSALSPG